MKKNVFLSLVIGIVFTIGFSACEKKTDQAQLPDEVLNVVEDDDIATTIFDDVFNEALLEDGELKSAEASVFCRNVQMEWSGDTLIKTITYNGECVFEIGNRTRSRSGQIIIKLLGGRIHKEGSTKIVTFNDYFVDSVKVEGVKTIVSSGISADTMEIQLDITLENGKLIFPDGTVVTRNSEKTRTWVINKTLFDKGDDAYYISGVSTGVNYMGDEYTRTLTDLYTTPGCPFIRSGYIDIMKEDGTLITIDYGSGDCDNEATVTKDGESETIILHLKRFRARRVR